MSDQSNILSRLPGRTTLLSGGGDNAAPVLGVMINSIATGTGIWASTETTDTFAATGDAGIVGSWLSTEAPDTFAGTGGLPITGTWASTGAADTFHAFVFVPPNFVWASTEAQDKWRTNAGFERLEIVDVEPNGSTAFNYTTTGRDRILILMYSSGGSGISRPSLVDTVTIDDHPEIVFTPQVTSIVGPNDDLQMMATQILWAYAPDVISNKTVHVTSDDGQSTTGNVSLYAVKGLNGNYSDPFVDPNHGCRGGAIGSLFPGISTQQVEAFLPLVTGPQTGGVTTTSIAFTSASHAVLSNVNLTVTSDGTGSVHTNYAGTPASVARADSVYFEVTFNTILGGSDYAAGLLWQGGDPADLITNGTNGIIIRGNGDIVSGGAVVGHVTAPTNGDVIGIAANASSRMLFARNITQGQAFNGNPQYNGFGSNASGGYLISGGYFGQTIVNGGVERGKQFASAITPYAFVGNTISGQQTYNFGATAFVGSPPTGFSSGWATTSTTTPTRSHYPSVVVGCAATVHSTGTYMPSAPSSFEEVTTHQTFGSQVTIDMLGYAKVCEENFLESDNELQIDGTLPHWQMVYDTLVVGNANPGDWDSHEAADSFHAVGYPGAFGVVGDFHSTEAKDVFAATGFVASVGAFNVTEAKDIFSAYGFQPLTGTWTSTEATDHFHGTGIGLGEDGTWISVEGIDIFAATGTVPISGQFDTFEAPDRFRALGAGVTRVRRRRDFFVT